MVLPATYRWRKESQTMNAAGITHQDWLNRAAGL